MARVFTYGSLMFDEVFTAVTGRRASNSPALLEGWRRHALRDRTYPAAVPAPGYSVQGIVWLDLSGDDLQKLDEFESTEYRRTQVEVLLADGQRVTADIYAWLAPALLLPDDWSEQDFRRSHLADFHRIHGRSGTR